MELTWDRVDLDQRTINFNTGEERSILDTSHQKGRAIVDIGEGLYGAPKTAKEYKTCDFVIEFRGCRVLDIKKGVKAVFVKAGLGDKFLGLHALRHTLATSAAAVGIDMRQIQNMLGHDLIKTTERVYTEYQRRMLRDVADWSDAHIRKVNRVQTGHKAQLRRMKKEPPPPDRKKT